MTRNLIALAAMSLAGLLVGLLVAGRADASFPPPASTDNVAAHATLLTCHYIENLVEKPKTNQDLLREYIVGYKNMEKAISEADRNDYSVKLIEPPAKAPRD